MFPVESAPAEGGVISLMSGALMTQRRSEVIQTHPNRHACCHYMLLNSEQLDKVLFNSNNLPLYMCEVPVGARECVWIQLTEGNKRGDYSIRP